MKKIRLLMLMVLITLMAVVARGAGAWAGRLTPAERGSNAPAQVDARPEGSVVVESTYSINGYPIEVRTVPPSYAVASVYNLLNTGQISRIAPGGIVQVKGTGQLGAAITISIEGKNQADVAYLCLSNGTCNEIRVVNGTVTVPQGTELPFTIVFAKK